MKCILSVLFFLGFVSLAVGQPLSLSVDEAVRMGLVRSHTLKATEMQAVAARARLQDANRARLPYVYGVGSYRRLSSNIPDFELMLPDSFLDGAFSDDLFAQPAILDRYSLQVRFEQPLFQGFRLEANRKMAEYGWNVAEFQYADTQDALNFMIREAYWRMYEAHALHSVIETALGLVDEQLRLVKNRAKHGMALNSDVLALQTRRSEVRLQQVETENLVRVSHLQLNHHMGIPLDRVIEPTSTIEVDEPPLEVEHLIAQALSNRPALRATESQVAAQSARVRMTRSGYFPQISLSGVYDYARPNVYFFPQEDLFNGTWEAGVTVSLDLWNWGRTQVRVREAQAAVATLEEQLAGARSAVEMEVRALALELERSREAVLVLEEGMKEAREFYRVVGERYGQGAALNAEVLDAEYALRTAETSHVQALVAFAIARADLLRATGTLTNP